MTHEARVARMAAKSIFANFAATITVAATVATAATLLYEVTLQTAALELHNIVTERSRKVAAVVPATTAARRAILLPSAQISSGKGPLLLCSSREKPRPSDARFSVTGPYCC